jgi:hypothetical protein
MAKLLEEIHPGAILLQEFMKPMGISARQDLGEDQAVGIDGRGQGACALMQRR